MGFMDLRLAPWMTSVYGVLTAGSSVIRRRRTVIQHIEPDSAIALVTGKTRAPGDITGRAVTLVTLGLKSPRATGLRRLVRRHQPIESIAARKAVWRDGPRTCATVLVLWQRTIFEHGRPALSCRTELAAVAGIYAGASFAERFTRAYS
jgi:hypothetical protein